MVDTIAFDADDTLWQNEHFFRLTQQRFESLLAAHAPADLLHDRLVAAERRNLGHYGFGIKGFVLSMIETALDVTGDRVPAAVIRDLIETGQEMLRHPIDLLPHVEATVTALAAEYRLLLVTKGDLLDQERKLAQSGLGEYFDAVEIVSDKTVPVYAAIFARHGIVPGRAAMVGNSLKSDVIPAIGAGAWGIHVPHDLTWSYEAAEAPHGHPRFREIADLSALPACLAGIVQVPT
jgi:putative hydrolase of the HAD superfamily